MPIKLFKYRLFSALTLRCLTEAEVFYAPPQSFNDPLDCDPTLQVDFGRPKLEGLLFHILARKSSRDEEGRRIGERRMH